ncbi:unnamed protein product [Linum trigynum]|uniref:Amino acid transporter transmembrane domain-containing protein n=1 Tax=Linum trigynum TaxID=586398 RepID=A0AAV2GK60_9ROSI
MSCCHQIPNSAARNRFHSANHREHNCSIVGTGILGLPFALRVASWLAGSFAIIVAGIPTYYCMILLVQCRDKMATEEPTTKTRTCGDLVKEDVQKVVGGDFKFSDRQAISPVLVACRLL